MEELFTRSRLIGVGPRRSIHSTAPVTGSMYETLPSCSTAMQLPRLTLCP